MLSQPEYADESKLFASDFHVLVYQLVSIAKLAQVISEFFLVIGNGTAIVCFVFM